MGHKINKSNIIRRVKLFRLAKMMNKQNDIPLPITNTLLDCIDLVITTLECDFLIEIGNNQFNYSFALKTSKLKESEFKYFFFNLIKKGIIWEKYLDHGKTVYIIAPILVGWFEYQLSNGKETKFQKEFSKRLNRLFLSWKKYNILPVRTATNHFIKKKFQPFQSIAPVDNSLSLKKLISVNKTISVPESKILTSFNVQDLIRQIGDSLPIALMHCFCRQFHKLVDEQCNFEFPKESCLVIGKDMATYTIKYGFGQKISMEKAIDVIQECSNAGAIHTVFHDRDNTNLDRIAICNCCKDCCGVYGSYNNGLMPLYFKCYFIAETKNLNCSGCGRCQKFCPINAISLEDKFINIHQKKCIGCGQCVLKCKNDNISLVKKERNVFLPFKKASN